MEIKIFTKKNCPNCPNAKKLGEELKKQNFNIKTYDLETPNGLAESVMYDVLSTPSIIITNKGQVVKEFLGTVPTIDEVKKICQ